MNNELDFGKALSSPGPKFTSRFGFAMGLYFIVAFTRLLWNYYISADIG